MSDKTVKMKTGKFPFMMDDFELRDDTRLNSEHRDVINYYWSWMRQYNKCESSAEDFMERLRLKKSIFYKTVADLKKWKYIPNDLFGKIGLIKKPRKEKDFIPQHGISIPQHGISIPQGGISIPQGGINHSTAWNAIPQGGMQMPLLEGGSNNSNNANTGNNGGSPDGSPPDFKNINNIKQGTGQYSEPDIINQFIKKLELKLKYSEAALVYLATTESKDKISPDKIKAIDRIFQGLDTAVKAKINPTEGTYFYENYSELICSYKLTNVPKNGNI